MKDHSRKFIGALFIVAAGLSLHAAPADKKSADDKAKPTAEEAPLPKSTFEIPASPEKGRDPFFPTSERLFGNKTTPSKAAPVNNAALVFNGISGTREQPLAMINGHTFAEGEEAIVNTPSGRLRVRCIQIQLKTALIEVDGQKRELHFQDH